MFYTQPSVWGITFKLGENFGVLDRRPRINVALTKDKPSSPASEVAEEAL